MAAAPRSPVFPTPAIPRIFAVMSFTFEWDDVKASENLKKHGVSFSKESTVFADTLISNDPRPVTF